MALSHAYGEKAERGGWDITIELTAEEAQVIGGDADLLCSMLDTTLWALTLLRTGKDRRQKGAKQRITAKTWHTVVQSLGQELAPRLEGIADAAIRAHRAQDGTLDHLALAMDVPRSTAQYRRTKVTGNPVGDWEQWALAPATTPANTGTYTISLSEEEEQALGIEASQFADWVDTALWGLAMLRTGQNLRRDEALRPADLDSWYWVINDLTHRLEPRLKGIVDAAIRTHAAQRGTVADLASALGLSRGAAQYRRAKILDVFPSGWERWAIKGGPQDRDRAAEDAANPAMHVPLPPHRTEVMATAFVDGRVGAICACGWTSKERTTNTVQAALWGQAHVDEEEAKTGATPAATPS